MKVVGDLKSLIGTIAEEYISTNSEDFRSNVPGPIGADGPIGPIGVSVHHLKGTSTTQDEGDFAYPGETDTYTFYPDANETYPLGWFNVRNGQDAFNYAVIAGYAGTEADFYLELAYVREYFEQSEVNAASTHTDAVQTASDREAVAADRVIVIDAKAIVLAAKDATAESADTVQEIFLGTKPSDPIVDNQGNPLVVGVMYFNSISGTLRIWSGTEWNLGAFSVAGAVLSVNGRDGVVELTKSDVGLDNVTNESKATMFTSPTFTGTVTGVTKDMVGLDNVDNTADVNKNVLYADTAGGAPATDVSEWAKAPTKPEYTATEVGLGNVTNESKSTMFTSPSFTGTPSASTANVGTSTTQLATTAFVVNEINKIEEW